MSSVASISTSERFQSLCAFTSVYGIGPVTARKLYSYGLRTIEHLQNYYGIHGSVDDGIESVLHQENPSDQAKFPEISTNAGLALKNDFDQP